MSRVEWFEPFRSNLLEIFTVSRPDPTGFKMATDPPLERFQKRPKDFNLLQLLRSTPSTASLRSADGCSRLTSAC